MGDSSAPVPAPALGIPDSTATVSVSLIDTTSNIIAKTGVVVTPHIDGHDEFNCPCFSFLIENKQKNTKILFDLGIRKDSDSLSPLARKLTAMMTMKSEKNVADILGVTVNEIDAIVWSHHHFDHIGDPSPFPSSTSLVVGPGFKKEFLPGYPAREDSWILESDYKDRTMTEIDFAATGLKLGQFEAYDYFCDGSFYLLNCPGHSIGHMMALARTTPSTFVLMGADCCHHGGEFRPSKFTPIPESVELDPRLKAVPSVKGHRSNPCPGSLYVKIHPKNSRTEAFYELNNPKNSDTVKEAMLSQRKLEEFDADPDILVLTAHDADALSFIKPYPATIGDWKSKEWKDSLTWAFLKDFAVDG